MATKFRYAIMLLLALNGYLTLPAQTNPNEELSANEHLILATDWFQKSAEMRACYYQAYQLAKLKVNEHVAAHTGTKPMAVIFDIDETLLDNSPYEVHLIKTGTHYTRENWKEWTQKAQAKALPGALDFTKYAQSKGVEVFYISNRKIDEMESTLSNLRTEHFPNADSLHLLLRALDQSGDKSSRRNQLLQTYDVLLYVGDNLTDFSEEFAKRGTDLGFGLVDSLYTLFGDKFIILPNPMYGEWENAIYGNNPRLTDAQKKALRKEILEGY
jgi:5'-nucleotidase (lipoprotein e(P4) family)